MQIETVSDFRRVYRQGKYAWPGGYPLYFITADGEPLSFEGAKDARRQIIEAIKDNDVRSGWRVCAVAVNWEDPFLLCTHTGERIESAYVEESEEAECTYA